MSVFNIPLDLVRCVLLPMFTYRDLGVLSGVCSDWRAYVLEKHAKQICKQLGAEGLIQDSKMNPLELLDLWYCRHQPLSCGENEGAMISKDGNLLVWQEFSERTKLNLTIQPRSSRPISVSCGYGHAVVVMDDGAVLCYGSNSHGQLGLGDKIDRTSPVPIKVQDVILSAQAGDKFSIFLTKSNRVLISGKFPISAGVDEPASMLVPTEISLRSLGRQELITQIAAGGSHMLLLTNLDRILSAGKPDDNQLGRSISSDEKANEFHPVSFVSRPQCSVVQVSAGATHSLVLFGDGSVFTFGKSSSGELGLPRFRDANTAQVIPNLPKIIAVSAGNHHSLFLAGTKNKIVACGMGTLGQLGYRSSFWSSTYPRDSALPKDEQKRIKHIAAGNGFSACLAGDFSDLFTCGKSSLCAGAGHGVNATSVLPVFSRVPDL